MASNAVARVDDDGTLEQAILKAAGLDKVPPAQRDLAINIAKTYGLDLMLKHLIIVDGRPYITRDGLIHVALRSGQFDGIEVTDPVKGDTHWTCRATVYRKDMSRGITYPGRYPINGMNAKFAPEMAIKVSEVMALRRAFDVSAPVIEERWDLDDAPTTVPAPRPVVPLAERAAARRAEVEARATDAAASSPQPAEEVPTAGGTASSAAPHEPDLLPASSEVEPVVPSGAAPSEATKPDQCESLSDPAMPPRERCRLFAGHKGVHRAQGISWPNPS